jgi:hypothetical protein
MRRLIRLIVAAIVVGGYGAGMAAGQTTASSADALHRPLDELLDLYVRDGLVYYRALQGERGKLAGYLASLAEPAVAAGYPGWSRAQQTAFWINAYNAFVLDTVIDHYPIRGRSSDYPPDSIRQVSGAFDRMKHQAAGRSLTLDEIETTILTAFNDPRVFFALGRGAIGSGRLHSEAYTSGRLEQQLAQAQAETAVTPKMILIARSEGELRASPLFGWRQDAFVAAYANKAADLAGRTPIERAVISFIDPYLLPSEREFLQRNNFQLKYQDLDWRLNDLTGSVTTR